MLKIVKFFDLFLYTCVNNISSIITGCMIAALSMFWLSTYFSKLATFCLCPIATFVIFLMLAFIKYGFVDFTKHLMLKSSLMGMMSGTLWIMFLIGF